MVKARLKVTDKMAFGLATGILLPVIVFFLVYFFENKDTPFSQYLNGLWQLKALIKLVSLCVFINLGVFWYFLKIRHETAARGVLGATIFYAFLVLFSRLF